jgi:hypothetical protein
LFWAAIVELGTFTGLLVAGASGNTKAIAAIVAVPLFTTVLLGALYVTAPTRQRNEARLELAEQAAKGSNFELAFSWVRNYLQVGILNNGSSLKSALINFVVPDTIRRIYRLDESGYPARTGSQLSTSEELAPGVKAIYWQEANIDLPGFGTSTLMHFGLPGFPENEVPVSFRIGGDEIGGWLAFNIMVGPPVKPTSDQEAAS